MLTNRSTILKLFFALSLCAVSSIHAQTRNEISAYNVLPSGLQSGEDALPNVMLVFDISGSMHFLPGPENDVPPFTCAGTGTFPNCDFSPLSRSSIARTAMQTVFASLRGRTNLGLMLYDAGVGGGDLFSPVELFDGTHYTQIATQLNTTDNAGAIGDGGGTPIEGSLLHTLDYFNQALPTSQNRTGTTPVQYIAAQQCPVDTFVILVTDGVPTVSPRFASGHQNACTGDNTDCTAEAAADLLAAGYQTYVVGFAGNTTGIDQIATAGDTGPTAFTAANGDDLIAIFADIFSDIFERTSSFSGGTVLGNNASGSGVQIYPTLVPIVSDGINEVTWTGTLQSFFVDSNNFLRQNNSQNGNSRFLLNENSDRIFEFQNDPNQNNELRYADFGPVRTPNEIPTLIDIEDFANPATNLQPIWDASKKLSDQNPEFPLAASDTQLSDYRTRVRRNRNNYNNVPSKTTPNRHRYIFTCIDDDINADPSNPITTCSGLEPGEVRAFEWTGNNNQDFRLTPAERGYILGTPNDAGIPNGQKNALARDIIAFIRGDESLNPDASYESEDDDDYVPPIYRKRTLNRGRDNERHFLMGDIVNSNALQVGPRNEFNDDSYEPFSRNSFTKRNVVYVGANDGMLHAFNAGFLFNNPTNGTNGYSTRFIDFAPNGNIRGRSGTAFDLGQELWAYVPQSVLPHLRFLASPAYTASQHVFYVDGQMSAFDARIFTDPNPACNNVARGADIPANCTYINHWGTILVATTRQGGTEHDVDTNNDGVYDATLKSSMIILDITDTESEPTLLAEVSHDEIGITSSAPALVREAVDSSFDINNENWYLVFGSGPNDLQTFTSDRRARLFKYQLGAPDSINNFGFDNNDGYARNGVALNNISNNSFVGNMVARDWTGDDITDGVYFGTVTGTELAPSGDLRRITVNGTSPDEVSVIIDTNEPTPLAPLLVRDESLNNWVISHSGRFFTAQDWNYQSSTWMYAVREKFNLVARGELTLADQNFTPVGSSTPTEVAVNLTDNDASLVDVTGIEINVQRIDQNGDSEFSNSEVSSTLSGSLSGLPSVIPVASGTRTPNSFEELSLVTSGMFDDSILGWRRELTFPTARPNERFLQSPFVIPGADAMQFTTYIPPEEACEVLPSGATYLLSFVTGTAFFDARLFASRENRDGTIFTPPVPSGPIIDGEENDNYQNIVRGRPVGTDDQYAETTCIERFSVGLKSVDGSTATETLDFGCTAPSRKSWVEIDLSNF